MKISNATTRATLTRATASNQIISRNNGQSYSQSYAITNRETLVLPAPKVSWLILAVVVLCSALSVIYVKDYNRNLFITYQNLQRESIAAQETEGKLLMEQGLVASRTHIQEIAEHNLSMQMPVAKSVVILKV